jgi:LmbE family N-acetylglucosaminyl deacetylase
VAIVAGMSSPLFVVSPHLDDAVLSLGGAIGGSPGSIVATVCTALPPDPHVLTRWDEWTGFTSAEQAMRARHEEDVAALSLLSAEPDWLGFLDGQYRHPWDHRRVVDAIATRVAAHTEHRPAGPLGIHHRDHVATARAFTEAMDELGSAEFWLYAEIPYYRVYDTEMDARLSELAGEGLTLEVVDLGGVDDGRKVAACYCYASQVARFPATFLEVPELVWRVTR